MNAYQRSLNSFANFHLISLRLLLSEDFDGEEEEEEEKDSKQQASNENQNIATPAVKPRRVAGNDAITVEPLLKHNGPSLKTPAVVGSIVRNDDGKCFIQ